MKKNRIIALALLVVQLLTQTVSYAPSSVKAEGTTGQSTGVDILKDKEKSSQVHFSFKDGSEEKISVVTNTGLKQEVKPGSDGNYTITGIRTNDISKFNMKLQVKLDDIITGTNRSRTITSGDYFEIPFPDGLSLDAVNETPITMDGSTELAKYIVTNENGISKLRVTFTDNAASDLKNSDGDVDPYKNITLNVGLNFNFDPSKIESTDLQLVPAAGNHAIKITVPAVSTKVGGVTVDGDYSTDTTDNQNIKNVIKWNAAVGTESAGSGVSMNGIGTEFKFNKADVYFNPSYKEGESTQADAFPDEISATYGNTRIGLTRITQAADIASSDTVTYRYNFPEGSKNVIGNKFSFTSYVTADAMNRASKASIESKGANSISVPMTVSLIDTAVNSGTELMDATSGSNILENSKSVPLPGMKINKSGVQMDSTTYQWTIKVNSGKSAIWKTLVSDKLSDFLTYIDNDTYKIKVTDSTGKEVTASKSDTDIALDTTGLSGVNYYIDSKNNTFKVLFSSPVYDEYTITFYTSVDAEKAVSDNLNGGDANKFNISNVATATAAFPGGNGKGPGTVWGTPAVETVYSSSHISLKNYEEDSTKTSETGILHWSTYPSTDNIKTAFDKAVINVSIPADTVSHSFYGTNGNIKIWQKVKDTETGTTSYREVTDLSEKNISIAKADDGSYNVTIPYSALPENSKVLDNIKITFDTFANDYFNNESSKKGYDFKVKSDLKLYDSNGKVFSSDDDSAVRSLKNNLIESNVISKYDKTDNTPYFEFTVDTNNNNNKLTGEKLSLDLSDKFLAGKVNENGTSDNKTGTEKIPDSYFKIVADGYTSSTEKPLLFTKELSDNGKTATTFKVYLTDEGKTALSKQTENGVVGLLDKYITIDTSTCATLTGEATLSQAGSGSPINVSNATALTSDGTKILYNKTIVKKRSDSKR